MESKGFADQTGKMNLKDRIERDKNQIKDFSIEEMKLMMFEEDPPNMWIQDDFVSEHLTEWVIRIEKIHTDDPEELKVSNVRCPFCKQGLIRIINIKPDFSYGAFGRQGPLPRSHHTDNNYHFDCTNEDCGARFYGSECIMRID
ncbi:hypothetical protein ACFLZ9_01835 [Patescibacteria group bacterium]